MTDSKAKAVDSPNPSALEICLGEAYSQNVGHDKLIAADFDGFSGKILCYWQFLIW